MNRARSMGRPIAVLGSFLLATAPLHAGIVYEIEVKDHEQSPPKTESIEAAVEGRSLKMGVDAAKRGSPGDMIFRGDRREMVVVDHDDKSYVVIDKASMGRLAGQVNNAMAQMQKEMQEALKDLPPDQREAVKQMMQRQMPATQQPAAPPKSELKKTGERATINGYPCVKYEVWSGGRKVSELWVTNWSNITGGKEAASVFEDMADFFHELMEAMPQMGQGGPTNDNHFAYMKEIGGFPVVSKDFGDDGSLEGESMLRSARRQTIDPDAFEPPSGYKRQEMFGGR